MYKNIAQVKPPQYCILYVLADYNDGRARVAPKYVSIHMLRMKTETKIKSKKNNNGTRVMKRALHYEKS